MQEKFVLKAIKKVAAISTGIAMLGATLTGAMALDLADYPAPFVSATGIYDNANVFVVGANAAAADTLGLADITTSLQYLAKTEVASSGTVVVVGGDQKLADIPLKIGLNDTTDGFTQTVDDSDLESFLDTTLNINMNDEDEDYDIHEEITLGGATGSTGSETIAVETGLSFGLRQREEWKERVFIPIMRNSIKYNFKFDENLKDANFFTTTNGTFGNTIKMPFLGKTLEVASATNTTVTVNVGDKFQLKSGDSVEIEGKKITFHQAGNSKALIEVDGSTATVSDNDDEVINGLEVRVEDLLDEQGIEFDAVTLWVGKQAREQYKDNDPFVGEDQTDPLWRWDLASLNTNNPTIGILWDLNIDTENERANPLIQHPIYEGEQICLPWDYACIKFDSLKIDKYQDYEVDFDTVDLYNDTSSSATAIRTSANVIKINAVGASATGLLAQTSPDDTTLTKTDTIYIEANSTRVNVYRRKQDESKAVLAKSNVSTDTGGNTLGFKIDYRDSTFPVYLNTFQGESGARSFNLTFQTEQSNDNNLTVFFKEDAANSFKYLGHEQGYTTTTKDIYYLGTNAVDISNWKENTRTVGGIMIKDPEADASSDTFHFSVPADDKEFKANIIISAKGKTGVEKSGKSYIPTKVTPVTKLHTEISDPTAYNLVVVGGPCANPLAEDLFGYTCSGWAFKTGEAVVKLVANGDHVAMLVAGTTADDTRRAAKAVANYDSYKFKGTEKVVKGTSATDIMVE
ncbi:hypothetical protein HY643_05405 [Candidatus Woesearchaeota archaeon]|nr:hypothetical protein [Candidatus Woesearchaeota archaeon]